MKYILTSLLLMSTSVMAKEVCSTSSSTDETVELKVVEVRVPSHLRGATITVTLANGRTSVVPAEKFKVVPRKQERVVTKVSTTTKKTCKDLTDSKNRISLLAGSGTKAGLTRRNLTGRTRVETETGAVGGLQYQRSLTDKISVGVQGQTNETGSLMIGLDF